MSIIFRIGELILAYIEISTSMQLPLIFHRNQQLGVIILCRTSLKFATNAAKDNAQV